MLPSNMLGECPEQLKVQEKGRLWGSGGLGERADSIKDSSFSPCRIKHRLISLLKTFHTKDVSHSILGLKFKLNQILPESSNVFAQSPATPKYLEFPMCSLLLMTF